MGKKYIIELEDEPFVRKSCLHGEEGLYRAVGFKSLVFDEVGLSKLTPLNTEKELAKAKQEGADEAWEFMRLSDEDLKEIFPEAYKEYGRDGIVYMSYYQAKTMYDEWLENQPEEVAIGDEVVSYRGKGVVIYVADKWVKLLNADGIAFNVKMEDGKKTGRHFSDVADLLEKIK